MSSEEALGNQLLVGDASETIRVCNVGVIDIAAGARTDLDNRAPDASSARALGVRLSYEGRTVDA